MKNYFLFISAFLIGQAAISQCVDESNVFAFIYAGKNYEIVKENKSWVDAATCAVERGGALARIDSIGENTAIFNAITDAGVIASSTVAPDGGSGAYIWLGGTDKNEEGIWKWDIDNTNSGDQFWMGAASGSPVGGLFTNWGNEPDDFLGQDGLGLSINGWPLGTAQQWNDVDTINTLYFCIEYPITDLGTGIDEKDKSSLIIYPNPVQDVLNISNVEGTISAYTILTINGTVIVTKENISAFQAINISHLEKGTYFLKLIRKDGSIYIEKFIH